MQSYPTEGTLILGFSTVFLLILHVLKHTQTHTYVFFMFKEMVDLKLFLKWNDIAINNWSLWELGCNFSTSHIFKVFRKLMDTGKKLKRLGQQNEKSAFWTCFEYIKKKGQLFLRYKLQDLASCYVHFPKCLGVRIILIPEQNPTVPPETASDHYALQLFNWAYIHQSICTVPYFMGHQGLIDFSHK